MSLENLPGLRSAFSTALDTYAQNVAKASEGQYSFGEGQSDWLGDLCSQIVEHIRDFGLPGSLVLPDLEKPAFVVEWAGPANPYQSPFEVMVDPDLITDYVAGHAENVVRLTALLADIDVMFEGSDSG